MHNRIHHINITFGLCVALPSNKSEGNIEFPLVAAAVLPTRPVQVLGEVDEAGQLLQLAVDQVFRASEASDSSKESQHLSTSQHLEERRMRIL